MIQCVGNEKLRGVRVLPNLNSPQVASVDRKSEAEPNLECRGLSINASDF